MKRTCLYPVLSVVLSVSAVLAAERTYTGADGGDWDTAANWTPEGVPTASDEVVITNGWVSLAQSAAIASLNLSGGTLTVGGATASAASQTPLDPGFAGTLSLTVTGDATVSGQISVGGLRQAARSVLAVGGDLTLDPGGVLAVGHLHNAAFYSLQLISCSCQLNKQKKIYHAVHSRLTLSHTDGLHKNLVVAGGLTEDNGLTRLARHSSQ